MGIFSSGTFVHSPTNFSNLFFPVKAIPTSPTLLQGNLNPPPILTRCHLLPQPPQESEEPVFLISPPGHCDGHEATVDAEEAFLVPIGADEAEEEDKEEEEEEPEDNDRVTEQVDVGNVGLAGKPDAGGKDGDGAEEGNEVEDCDYVIAHRR
ncbi:hypothetical protein Droror1_Dr00024112 [Drosera rotundifolia]